MKRTLTNRYNSRPALLANAYRVLDEAVAAAFGWPADISDAEPLLDCRSSTTADGNMFDNKEDIT